MNKLLLSCILLVGLVGCKGRTVPTEFLQQQVICLTTSGDTLFQTDQINVIWTPDGGGFFGRTNSWIIWYGSPTKQVGIANEAPRHRYPLAKKVIMTGTCILKEKDNEM